MTTPDTGSPSRGLAQFAPGGRMPDEKPVKPEPELVIGTVRGYRWWTLPRPPLKVNPAYAEQAWPRTPLYGARDAWAPGENTAECQQNPVVPLHADPAPGRYCSCGFWATWQPASCTLYQRDSLQVCGVIEAWGQLQLGTISFRAQKARIAALYVASELIPDWPGTRAWSVGSPGELSGALARAGFTGRVHEYAPLSGRLHEGAWYQRESPWPTPDQLAAAEVSAQAWLAVIGDRLEQQYPGVRVFETAEAMYRCFPPDETYAQPDDCPVCAQDPDQLHIH